MSGCPIGCAGRQPATWRRSFVGTSRLRASPGPSDALEGPRCSHRIAATCLQRVWPRLKSHASIALLCGSSRPCAPLCRCPSPSPTSTPCSGGLARAEAAGVEEAPLLLTRRCPQPLSWHPQWPACPPRCALGRQAPPTRAPQVAPAHPPPAAAAGTAPPRRSSSSRRVCRRSAAGL